jgi:TM2 domain-containing membrane protein YozV
MNKSFKGEYISFLVRLAKRLAPVILLLIFALFKIYYGHSFAGNLANYRTHFLIFLILCFLIGIYYHTDKIRTVVNEIRFSDNKLQIIGRDFNSKFEDNLDINKVMIEIQEEALGKNKTRFCLEIYLDDKYYYLNKFNDWQYKTLAEIIDEYKLKTGKIASGMEFYSKLTDIRK